MKHIPAGLAPLLAALLSTAAAAAPQAVTVMTPDVVATYEQVRPDADFVKRVVMVPMRDGTKLYTVIMFKGGARNGPILLSRTPYDAKSSAQRAASRRLIDVLPAMDEEFVNDVYIRVYQDIRGMHHSEGQRVLTRPIVGPLNNTGIDESTDATSPPGSRARSTPGSGPGGRRRHSDAVARHRARAGGTAPITLMRDRHPTSSYSRPSAGQPRASPRLARELHST